MAVAKDTNKKPTSMKVRYNLLFLMLGGVVFCIFAKLYYLQVIKYREYTKEAVASRVRETPIKAERGEVYMMNGSDEPEAVIMNERVWDVYIDPKYALSFGESHVAKIEKNLTEILETK